MEKITNRSATTASILAVIFLLPTFALHAAITDTDLAKVTQLIQEGKIARAKAEITILLDDNPNDPNASKLRKLSDSIGKSETTSRSQSTGNGSKSSGPDAGPSATETIQWIQSNMKQLQTDFTLTSEHSTKDFSMQMKAIELTNGKLKKNENNWDLPSGLSWQSDSRISGLSIPVANDEIADRMKKALEHLIKLSGGGQKPKEAF